MVRKGAGDIMARLKADESPEIFLAADLQGPSANHFPCFSSSAFKAGVALVSANDPRAVSTTFAAS